MAKAALLDVDGTLIDANYQHALAWYLAFREHDITVPVWKIHRAVGMGGDQLVPALVGQEVDQEKGDDIRDKRSDIYEDLIEEVAPFEGAHELVCDLLERDISVVLASSASEEELEHYLDLLDVRTLVDAWTTRDDVEQTKPEPDLVKAALEKVGRRRGRDGRRHQVGHRGRGEGGRPHGLRDDGWVVAAGTARRGRRAGLRVGGRAAREAGRDAARLSGLTQLEKWFALLVLVAQGAHADDGRNEREPQIEDAVDEHGQHRGGEAGTDPDE